MLRCLTYRVKVMTERLADDADRSRGMPRVNVRNFLIAVCVLGVLMGFAGRYLAEDRQRRADEAAVWRLNDLNAAFTISSRDDVLPDPSIRNDYFDPRNESVAVGLTLRDTLLGAEDFEAIKRLRNLGSLRIVGVPIDPADVLKLRDLPRLTVLVLQSTGLTEEDCERLEEANPRWEVFLTDEAMKAWSLNRARTLLAKSGAAALADE